MKGYKANQDKHNITQHRTNKLTINIVIVVLQFFSPNVALMPTSETAGELERLRDLVLPRGEDTIVVHLETFHIRFAW